MLAAEDSDFDDKDFLLPDDGYDYSQHFTTLPADQFIPALDIDDENVQKYDAVYEKPRELWTKEEVELFAALDSDAEVDPLDEEQLRRLQFEAQQSVDLNKLRWGTDVLAEEHEFGGFDDDDENEFVDELPALERERQFFKDQMRARTKIAGGDDDDKMTTYTGTFLDMDKVKNLDFDKFTAITAKTAKPLNEDERELLEEKFLNVRREYRDREVGTLNATEARGDRTAYDFKELFDEAFDELVLGKIKTKKQTLEFERRMNAYAQAAEEDDEEYYCCENEECNGCESQASDADEKEADEEDADEEDVDEEDVVDTSLDADCNVALLVTEDEVQADRGRDLENHLRRTYLRNLLKKYFRQLDKDPLADMCDELEEAYESGELESIMAELQGDDDDDNDILYSDKRKQIADKRMEMWRVRIEDEKLKENILLYTQNELEREDSGPVEFLKPENYAPQVVLEHDAVTVLSTLSTAYNRPGKIAAPPKPKKVSPVVLGGREQIPLGVLPEKLERAAGVNKSKYAGKLAAILEESSDDEEDTDIEEEEEEVGEGLGGSRRVRGETAEEKRARKKAAQEAKKASREAKKERQLAKQLAREKKQKVHNPYDLRSGIRVFKM